MNTFTTTSIEATLGRKLITRADQFFSHSQDCIIDKMIQNSRRAKANTVQFILDDGDLIIADDGHGLTADNAHILLMAGGSNNDDATEVAEKAAGLGFFALAKYDVVVRSHDWEMQVPKEAFTGGTTAALTRGFPHQDGLSIRIRAFIPLKGLAEHEGGKLDEIIERCIRWYNDEGGDYSLQEENHSASFATLVAKITGASRSHFQREVQSAVLDKAYSLMSEVEGDEETIVMKVVVNLKKGGSPVVTVERDTQLTVEAA